MKFLIVIVLVLFSFSLFALPENITLKSKTETFTHKYMLALEEGKIWIKPIDNSGSWQLLNGIGLPAGKKFDSPAAITSIQADGNNLVALDSQNHIYLMKFDFMKHDSWKWKHKIGLPFKKQMKIPHDVRAWAVSHRGNVSKYYEDIDGNKFSIKIGISSIYILRKNGTQISYVDPWIAPNFNQTFATPLDGRFIATNLSASSSTLFIINKSGEMYTRLYDYDIVGENPIFSYTYLPQERKETLTGFPFRPRRLPSEGWRSQPAIDGLITDHITIVQNGLGNAGRELRVEGVDNHGNTGYFYKQIFDTQWNFQIDNHEITKDFLLKDEKAPLAGPMTQNYSGTMQRRGKKLEVRLLNFHHHTYSALLQLMLDGITYKLPVHLRRFQYKKNGKITMKATFIIPELFDGLPIKKEFFGSNAKCITMKMSVKGDRIKAVASIEDEDEDEKRANLFLWLHKEE